MIEAHPAIIPAPDDPGVAETEAWRRRLTAWRQAARQSLDYSDALYRRDDLAWAARAFCCGFIMVYDQRFYDPAAGRYTLDAMLEQAESDFGGYDAIVLWHAYPRIGFDDRNQFDFYRDMPGGLAAVRPLADACHTRGTRLLLNYNPWDTATRREGKPDLAALVELTAAVDADGIFLDTMRHGSAEFRQALDAARPGAVLEPETDLPIEYIHDHHMSWGQWLRDSTAPGVLRNKWFERRHMMHLIRRWHRDHSPELHTAWMNGAGILHWENVFGSYNGWCPRDRSLLGLMLPVQRRFADFFISERWTPLVDAPGPGVFASLWEHGGSRLWTLVNRAEAPLATRGWRLPHVAGQVYIDLMAGELLDAGVHDGHVALPLHLPARGLGGVLSLPEAHLSDELRSFLAAQRHRFAAFDPSTAFPARAVKRLPASTAPPAANAGPPDPAVSIPPGRAVMRSILRNRECGTYDNAPFVDIVPRLAEDLEAQVEAVHEVSFTPVAVAMRCVTNAEYIEFVRATGYRPADPVNFLAHWHEGRPRAEQMQQPVVCIDLADARAYAAWRGWRLPTEHEWQRAAELCGDEAAFHGHGRQRVWNLTESEHSDGITRFVMLKGGADHLAADAMWYADGGPRPAVFSAKFLLAAPGLDRCGSIGFRCAADIVG